MIDVISMTYLWIFVACVLCSGVGLRRWVFKVISVNSSLAFSNLKFEMCSTVCFILFAGDGLPEYCNKSIMANSHFSL